MPQHDEELTPAMRTMKQEILAAVAGVAGSIASLRTDVERIDLATASLQTQVERIDLATASLQTQVERIDLTIASLRTDVERIDLTTRETERKVQYLCDNLLGDVDRVELKRVGGKR